MKTHERFTVGKLRDGSPAIFHQAPPLDVGHGYVAVDIRVPLLHATKNLNNAMPQLNKIADVLNMGWDRGKTK